MEDTMSDTTPDHDLLIELRTEMRAIKSAVKDIKDGVWMKINNLEDRTKNLEVKTSNYFIAMSLYAVALGFAISLLIYHLFQK
jgi:hypothetical protein